MKIHLHLRHMFDGGGTGKVGGEWVVGVTLGHAGVALLVSPPSLVPPWVQWPNELAREMYIKCALQWLQLQYPRDSDDS